MVKDTQMKWNFLDFRGIDISTLPIKLLKEFIEAEHIEPAPQVVTASCSCCVLVLLSTVSNWNSLRLGCVGVEFHLPHVAFYISSAVIYVF